MTNVRMEPGKIEIEGHAGFNIVCAGISTLAFATLAAMEESEDFQWVEKEIKDGYMQIRYKEKAEKEEACKKILRVLECGIWLVSAKYPDNVKTNLKIF